MKRASVLLCAALVLACAVSVADMIYIPIEKTASQADLICVAEVIGVPEAVPDEKNVPGYKQKIKGWFRSYNIKVTRVIKLGKGVKAAKGQELVVLARAPQPQQGGMLVAICGGPVYPNFKLGDSQVVILKAMKGKNQFYLPSMGNSFMQATEQNIERIERAANVAKWSWGKVSNGLQIAFIPRWTETQLRGPRTIIRRGKKKTYPAPTAVYVPCMIALRNTTDKPVSVNLFPMDKFLGTRKANDAGKAKTVPMYANLARARLKPFGPHNVVKIEPGSHIFIGEWGKGDYGANIRTASDAGQWAFTVSYASKRAKGPGGEALWTGRVESAPLKINFKAPVKK
jgi:hypothetical protein